VSAFLGSQQKETGQGFGAFVFKNAGVGNASDRFAKMRPAVRGGETRPEVK
jgi:hypothetical protein